MNPEFVFVCVGILCHIEILVVFTGVFLVCFLLVQRSEDFVVVIACMDCFTLALRIFSLLTCA